MVSNPMIRKITLQTDGIACTGCIEDMEIILRDTNGIVDAKVNYADEIIDIKYDSDIIDRTAVIHTARRIANISKIISET
ncbi:MAG: hypothetical protein AMS22_12280 [Thiotrichales bacterium SG8_50]|nr:MAG: hypothetical protein AMS22_12280 [Thiotrichales bacterium SG8_50]